MGQALYRKYRSKAFGEVVGQDHIVTTLTNAIKSGRISHAYLFTGPRGVGKTSVARILAHEVNQLPYKDESVHLDIIEIDAASNRRIDEIRELRDKVHIAPTSAKYKVYIIDEVHMLTREAFNALLKTLEEPPAHCIFILATTEAHKLPETIISRTQRFEFKPVSVAAAAIHLSQIAKKESLDIEPEALELLAQHGDGSFRDSISLLDQLSVNKKITAEVVRKALGLPPAESIDTLAKCISTGDAAQALAILQNLKEQGVDAVVAAKLLSQHARAAAIESNKAWALKLAKQLIEIPASANPQELLEIDVLEAASQNARPSAPASTTAVPAAVAEPVVKQPMPAVANPPKKPTGKNFDITQQWPDILGAVKQEAPALYTALRLAKPSLVGDKLLLAFEFPLHQKKANTTQYKDALANAIHSQTGVSVTIECVVEKAAAPATAAQPAQADTVNSISNIFGAAEVLES